MGIYDRSSARRRANRTMSEEDFVVCGPQLRTPEPPASVGRLLHDSLRGTTDDHVAYIDAATGDTVSYPDFLASTRSLARGLRNRGYNSDDVICVCCENRVDFFAPVVAALYLRIPVAVLNYAYGEAELLHALNISRPKLVFCSETTAATFASLARKVDFIEEIVLIGQVDCHDDFADLDVVDGAATAVMLCSSGTTGLPKVVMITHDNIATLFQHFSDPRTSPVHGDVVLGVLPLCHAAGFFLGLGALFMRKTVVILRRFDEHLFLGCIEKYRIPHLFIAPPLMSFLANSRLVEDYDTSSVVQFTCTSSPLADAIEAKAAERLPSVKWLRHLYGLTETTFAVITSVLGEKKGSLGKLLPGMSCVVRDVETGRNLGPNRKGELCVRGRLVMKGYYRNQVATEETFGDDGWLLTGDLGYYDEDEHFYIVGRLKELIKYKGFQVPPAELEALLVTHPKIRDAGVVGVPDDVAGELALAFVVEEDGAGLSEEEVLGFVAARISKAKHLHGGVRFVGAIPKTAVGKIARGKLRELLER